VQVGGPIQGTLKHSEKLGNETFAYVTSAALGDITARMDGTLPLEPGQTIELAFAAEHLYRFDADGKSI
jgi:multiple sugar transport system ATP-binding protein